VTISPVKRSRLAETALGVSPGTVLVLAGLESDLLRRLLDQAEPKPESPRALFARISPAPTTDALVQQVIDLLADTVFRLWPIWFTDINFAECRNDRLGRLAGTAMIRQARRRRLKGE
jgi:hypothetical protein